MKKLELMNVTKTLIIVFLCVICICMSACSKDEPQSSESAADLNAVSTQAPQETTMLPESSASASIMPSALPSGEPIVTPGTSALPSESASPLATNKANSSNLVIPTTSKPKKASSSSSNTASSSQSSSSSSSYSAKTAKLESKVQNGVILHAFNWSYTTIKTNMASIAAAGYSAVQTSPVQPPKDYSASYTDVSGQWWKLYQPLGFSIADKSWIGTKSQLTDLCKEADKYGVKIICDIVVNHLAAGNTSSTTLNPAVKNYESTIYSNYSTYFHSFISCNDGNIKNVVQGNIGMPDLNTGNSYVQSRVTSLLKSCIDCGVDGFRFDAAKHIETSSDGSYASKFWNNVLSSAKSYASGKGCSLYVYGEILNTVGSGRNISAYTGLMSVTDNKTGDGLLSNVYNHNASAAASSYYYTGQSASKLVIWGESHDTYMGSSGSMGLSSTKGVPQSVVDKAYSIAASRNLVTSLYFARPVGARMGSNSDTSFKSKTISKVNLFHNYFTDYSEYLSSANSVVINERYKTSRSGSCGAVLVNVNGNGKTLSNVTTYRLANKTYYDQITGNKFVVSNGKISGTIGSSGIAVVM